MRLLFCRPLIPIFVLAGRVWCSIYLEDPNRVIFALGWDRRHKVPWCVPCLTFPLSRIWNGSSILVWLTRNLFVLLVHFLWAHTQLSTLGRNIILISSSGSTGNCSPIIVFSQMISWKESERFYNIQSEVNSCANEWAFLDLTSSMLSNPDVQFIDY
jgi:hypothetical protein